MSVVAFPRHHRRPIVHSRSVAGVIHPFPAERDRRLVNQIGMRISGLDTDQAEQFLLSFFEPRVARLSSLGVAEVEVDRYVIELARAIWARRRSLLTGAA